MPGISWFSFIFLFLVPFLLCWSTARLLARRHPIYRRHPVQAAYWLTSGASVAVLVASRWLRFDGIQPDWFRFLMYAAYVWIIAQLLLLLILLIFFLAGWLAGKVKAGRRDNAAATARTGGVTRREFLRTAAAAAPLLSLAVTARTVYATDATVIVNRYSLAFDGLPDSLAGLKIAQISDTHIGPFFSLAKFERVLAMVETERPDLLAITGDLIDDLALLDGAVKLLTDFQPRLPLGIYFCWGNHEYFRDIGRIRRALRDSPVIILENREAKVLDGERPLYLAGVDYPWAKSGAAQVERRRFLTEKALSQVPPAAFTILLTHHPDFLANAFAAEVPLTLAGHTHGGQIAVFGRSLLPVQYTFMRGLYRQGTSYGYVHTGTGHWLPLRVGCPAEISLFTLAKGG